MFKKYRLSQILLNTIFLGLSLLIFSSPVSSETVVEITQGTFEPTPIAIPDFIGASPEENEIGAEMSQIVSNDLKTSGLFRPLAQSSFIENIHQMGEIPRFGDWRLTNAQILVTARVRKEARLLRVEFRLWDVFSEKQLEGIAFTGDLSDLRRLAHRISNAVYKRITGDTGYFDTQIVYIAESAPNTKKNTRRLAIMDQDGANHKFLSNGQNLVLTPRFSPIDPQIAYMGYTGQKKSIEAQVYLMNLKTNQKSPVGKFKGMTFAPRFSPDGSHLIFSQTQGGYSSLYVQDLKTHAVKRLTNSPAIDTSPCYSPDGSQIVFNSDRGGKRELYVMNKDGSNPHRISFGDGIYATPVWSPRGDLIAFTKITKTKLCIGVMRPDGSGERLISQGFIVEGPTWCPNGRLILYTRQTPTDRKGRGGTSRLYAIDITGKYEYMLPTPQDASAGAWSPLDYH
ncbi:MAG: Tol-Pal system protein TolB [Proteobacteria bacterium]|nr:Tol-Pal system protein TolB [Pseudomonadota bacterium]